MTKEEITNIVLNTKWEVNEQYPTDEVSEVVPFWNADIAFLVHAIRLKDVPENYTLVVTQCRPEKFYNLSLDDLGINWDDNNIRSMPGDKLLADEELHSEFLNGM